MQLYLLPTLRSLLRGLLWSFGAYGVLGFVLVGHSTLGFSMPAGEAVRLVVRDWLPWTLVTPLIFHLVWQLPLEGRLLRIALPVHVACALVVLSLMTAWMEGPMMRLGPQPVRLHFVPLGNPPPPWADPIYHVLHSWGFRSTVFPRPRPPRPPMAPPFTHPVVLGIFMLGMRFPVYLAIVSVAHAFYFYDRAQERERRSLGLEAGLVKARLEALRMQLQPHFLFNSLNSIAELVHKDPDKADEMLVALSDLLRLTLEKSDQQEIPLQQELEFVDRYLVMQKVRLADRLVIQRDISPEARRALVPVFLLQPVVENSLRHGLEPLPGGGTLTLRASVTPAAAPKPGHAPGAAGVKAAALAARELWIIISDTGRGLPEGKPSREGIGLSNTRARLQELYGTAAGINLLSNNGLTVELHLPYRVNSPEAEQKMQHQQQHAGAPPQGVAVGSDLESSRSSAPPALRPEAAA